MTSVTANTILTLAVREAEQIERRYSWCVGRGIRQVANKLARVNKTPILVLGNQKSGTTVIAALLAAYSGLSVTLDIDEMKAEVEILLHKGETTLSEFVSKSRLDFSRAIVKEPRLTFLFEQLAECFPQARFVLVARDPRQNIRSILNRLSIPGNLVNPSQNQLNEISPEWTLVLDGSFLGLEGQNYIEMMAARWNFAADIYLHNTDRIILVRYEDFLKDKVGEISSLANVLELSQKKDIAEMVDIQYQRAGKSDVSIIEFFGRENLMRIERICESRMKDLGYQFT
jgi:hypothetical protein